MKVRSVEISQSDMKSAKLFFDALCGFYDFSSTRALDMFARTGDLTVKHYRDYVGYLECWELVEDHKPLLERWKPDAMHFGCSYVRALACKDKFGLIVIDTPQGLHKGGNGKLYCEHFFAYPMALDLLEDHGVVVLYVNKRPYDKNKVGSAGYDEYEEYDFDTWQEMRCLFYGVKKKNGVAEVDEPTALAAYKRVAEMSGFEVKNMLMVPCYSDVEGLEPYAFRLGLELRRKGRGK